MTRVEADLGAELQRSPEVQLGGDRGEDIGDHLDSLFAATQETAPPPADVPKSAKPARLEPSAPPRGMEAAPALRSKPVRQVTQASPTPSPSPRPKLPEPAAQPRVSVTHASTAGRPGRAGLWTFLAIVALAALGGGLWLWKSRVQPSEAPRRAAPEEVRRNHVAPAASVPEEATVEEKLTEEAVGPEPPPSSEDRPEAIEQLKPAPPPPLQAVPVPARTTPQSKVVRPQPNKPPAAPPAAPELHSLSVSEPAPPAPVEAAPQPPVAAPAPAESADREARSAEPARPAGQPDAQAEAQPSKPPVVLQRIEPTYPPRALKRGDRGTVVLKVLVNEGGKVVRVVVEQGLAGSELEAAAIDAVLRWDYHPATENGHTIRAWTTEKFVFVPPSQTKD